MEKCIAFRLLGMEFHRWNFASFFLGGFLFLFFKREICIVGGIPYAEFGRFGWKIMENLWLGDEFPRFSFLEGSPRWSFSLWLEVPFLGDELPRFLG